VQHVQKLALSFLLDVGNPPKLL